MKNYFKKFSIMFVMSLILIFGGAIRASAATDDGLVGTVNFNNTLENSAKVGKQLTAPEKGWKRYDDINDNITYTGTVVHESNNSYYKGNDSYFTTTNNASIKFKVYTSKIRIMSAISTNWTSKDYIVIDGVSYSFSCLSSSVVRGALVFEKSDLSLKIHTIELKAETSTYSIWGLDAIDIDETGSLLPIDYSESVTLDKSTMNLTEGDSGQLTAITTPSSVGVTWTSSDPSIATVDSTGKVIGVKEGTCTITATTADGLTATCIVTVAKKDDPQPTNPTGDSNLFIELVDGQIKQYTVSQDEINKFTSWFENRDKDHSLTATYKFTKGTYKDYVVHDQIDWFQVR